MAHAATLEHPVENSDAAEVAALVARSRAAQAQIEHYTQAQVDALIRAMVWAVAKPGVAEKIVRWGGEFSANAGIRRHVRNPEKAWQEVFRINDAGMSYLVESLAPVCRPELKLNQLSNQAAILRGDMRRRLSEWHVGDDLDAEYQKRLDGLRPALELLEANGNAGRFGLLLTQFHLTPAEAREVLLRTLPTVEANRSAAPAATGAVSSMRDRLRARAAPATTTPTEAASGNDPTQDRGAALLSAWIAKLRRFSTETNLHGFFGFDGPTADALVAEMVATAGRCRLQSRLVEGLGRIKGGLRFDQAADRRAVLVSQLINEHVNFQGMSLDGILSPDRPRVEGGPPAFEPQPPPEPGFEIGDEPEPFGPLFCLSWVDVLADAVKRNVYDQGGAGMVDQKQNEALGAVLSLL